MTTLPSQFATALLTAGVRVRARRLGSGGLAAVIFFVFLSIARTSIQAQGRGEELTQRTRDPMVVEVLERMILENGVAFSHSDEADSSSSWRSSGA